MQLEGGGHHHRQRDAFTQETLELNQSINSGLKIISGEGE